MKYTIKDFLAGKVDVRCKTDEQKKAFLKACAKHGAVWRNGAKADEFMPFFNVITMKFGGGGQLTHGSRAVADVCVDFDKIDLLTAHRYQIVIESDGDTTTAKMVVKGREIKTATAKRNPADKANWRTGAQVAFDRLWEKQTKPEKPAEKNGFKVGDRVVCVCGLCKGEHGTIIGFGNDVAIEFDNDIGGHECGGFGLSVLAKSGHGWWCNAKNLRHEQPTKPHVREVKRHAEVGDYVKLTKAHFWFMEKGDIVRVSTVLLPDGAAMVREKDLARPSGCTTVSPNYEWNIFNDYVVLEGYQPGRDA